MIEHGVLRRHSFRPTLPTPFLSSFLSFEMSAFPTPFGRFGSVTELPSLHRQFASFNLTMETVVKMMAKTHMVIGGGFAANHFLRMAGHNYALPATSDIDFFVYGGVPPRYPLSVKETADAHLARAYRELVIEAFEAVVEPAGYIEINPPLSHGHDVYDIEETEAGDRLFTTGSNARMRCVYYGRYEGGVLKNILNLVFSDMSVAEMARKVDISLTAGFIYASTPHCPTLIYEHNRPYDVIHKHLRWMEPTSTHTPRQLARWEKYTARYNILPELRMTTDEFIARYDTLSDANEITLVGVADDLYGKAVSRRILGLPNSIFLFEEHRVAARLRIAVPILNPEDYDTDDERERTLSPIEWGGEDSC